MPPVLAALTMASPVNSTTDPYAIANITTLPNEGEQLNLRHNLAYNNLAFLELHSVFPKKINLGKQKKQNHTPVRHLHTSMNVVL